MFSRDRWLEIFDSIKKNKLRTFLSGFTVALGILIFVVLFGFGNGLDNTFDKFFKDDALNTMWVRSGRTSKPYMGYKANRRIEFDNKDLEDITSMFEFYIEGITPRISENADLGYKLKSNNYSIRGVAPSHQKNEMTIMMEGRYINGLDVENKERNVVIGRLVELDLFNGVKVFNNIFGAKIFRFIGAPLRPVTRLFISLPTIIGAIIGWLITTTLRRLVVIIIFILVTSFGVKVLIPPLDYLPSGNRNLIFGLMYPAPSYNLDALSDTGERLEKIIAPAWEATEDKFQVEEVIRGNKRDPKHDERVMIPRGSGEAGTILPPALDHYFLVCFEGRMFHGAIAEDKKQTVDSIALLNHATAGSSAPDTFSFAFQMPLFRVAGTTGSAIKVDVKGSDLNSVTQTAIGLRTALWEDFGPKGVQPSPPNFSQPIEELQIVPNDERLRELGMTRTDLGLAVQAAGEGILLFRDYEKNGELKDIKIINAEALKELPFEALPSTPIATPDGQVVDLNSLASLEKTLGPGQIRHVDRLRAVTLEVTAPRSMALEDAIEKVDTIIKKQREVGAIAPGVQVNIAGSSDALGEIKEALLGDGSFGGLLTSSLFLALFVVYLLMVVLFQSWAYRSSLFFPYPSLPSADYSDSS